MRWTVAATLFAAAVATRAPFLTDHLWAHDSVLYERAIAHFDPVAQQPHPPGYLWYVLLARAVNLVTDDPNRALTLISLVASAAAVTGLYALATRMFDERVGIIAAVFLLTSVTFWGESVVAYPYTLLAALSIGCALLFWRAMTGPSRGQRLILASFAWGIAVGFRLDLLLYLAPLWVVTAIGVRPRDIAIAVVSGIIPGTAWLAATANGTSGGLRGFTDAMLIQSRFVDLSYSVSGNGFTALTKNTYELTRYLGRALMFLALPLLAFLLPTSWRSLLTERRRAIFLSVWTLSPLPILLLVHIGEYGYAFSILPGLCVVAAWAITKVGALRGGRLALAAAAAVAGANATLFLASPMPLSAYDLARRDHGVVERIEAIEQLPRGCTVVVTGYDHLVVERYVGTRFLIHAYDPSLVGPFAPRPIFDLSRCTTTRTVVLWDDLLQSGEGAWRTLTMPHGALLRVAESADATRITTGGLVVHLR